MSNTWRFIWGTFGVLCFVFWWWAMHGDLSLLNVPIDPNNGLQKLESALLVGGVVIFGFCAGVFGLISHLALRWKTQSLVVYPLGLAGAVILFQLPGSSMPPWHVYGPVKLVLLTLALSVGAHGILYGISPKDFGSVGER